GCGPWAGLLSFEVQSVAARGAVASCAGAGAGYNRSGLAVGVADETGTHERKDLVPQALQPLRKAHADAAAAPGAARRAAEFPRPRNDLLPDRTRSERTGAGQGASQ